MSRDGLEAKTKDSTMHTTGKLEKSVVAPAYPSFWKRNGMPMMGLITTVSLLTTFLLYKEASYAEEQWHDYSQKYAETKRELKHMQDTEDSCRCHYDTEDTTSADMSVNRSCSHEDFYEEPSAVCRMCFPHSVGPIYNYTAGRWESCPNLSRIRVGSKLTRLESDCLLESFLSGRTNYFPIYYE